VPKGSLDGIAEKIRKELAEFEIGDQDLDVIFDPLIQQCSELARDEREFRQCLDEAISTLKAVAKKIK